LLKSKVESTLQRSLVMDLLARHADLDVEYVDESFDAELMERLAQESLEREEARAGDAVTPS